MLISLWNEFRNVPISEQWGSGSRDIVKTKKPRLIQGFIKKTSIIFRKLVNLEVGNCQKGF